VCVVCSGTQHNLWRASWAAGATYSAEDRIFVWQLPSGAALPALALPSDPTGQLPPVVRVHGAELLVARAAHSVVAVYDCGGSAADAPVPRRELVGHTGPIKAMSVDDGRVATGSEDGTARLWLLRTSKCTSIVRPGGGAVLEVQLVGQRLVVQHLCAGAPGGSATTLWATGETTTAEGGSTPACLARFAGWACLDPTASRAYVQEVAHLRCVCTQQGARSHALARPAQAGSASVSALAVNALYVLSTLLYDEEDKEGDDEDDEHAHVQRQALHAAASASDAGGDGAHQLAVWRASDGELLGTIDGLPWEPEAVALVGHAAVCVGFDVPPPHILTYDLRAVGARSPPTPHEVSFHAPVVGALLSRSRTAR